MVTQLGAGTLPPASAGLERGLDVPDKRVVACRLHDATSVFCLVL